MSELYSTRPKRGPIEAVWVNWLGMSRHLWYSTRPKRGPIEAFVGPERKQTSYQIVFHAS